MNNVMVKVKSSLFMPCRRMEWRYSSAHFSLGNGGKWSASRPGLCTPRTSLRYPLNRRMSGSQSQSGRFGDDIDVLPQLGIEQNPERPARSLVTIPSTHSRLYRGILW